jgi:hypothetical protein
MRTRRPIGTISPLCSARSMNSRGARRPRRGRPAHEGLHADDPARSECDDRLVVDDELLLGHGVPQVGHQLRPAKQLLVLILLVERETALALALRQVHRDVRVPKQLLGVASALAQRDPDARPDLDLMAPCRHGLTERLEDAPPDVGESRAVALDQDRELVAPQARDHVRLAQAARETVRHPDQQLIAGRVPVAVVDLLELVEVEEEHRHLIASRATPQGPLDLIVEQRAIGEAGEAVVEGLMRQLLLQRTTLAHVPRGEDDPAHSRVVPKVRDNALGVPPGSVGVPHPQLQGRPAGARTRVRVGEGGLQVRPVVGMQEIAERRPDQRPGEEPEHLPAGVGHEADPPVVVDDGDHVGGVLHQRPKATLTRAEGPLPLERDRRAIPRCRHAHVQPVLRRRHDLLIGASRAGLARAVTPASAQNRPGFVTVDAPPPATRDPIRTSSAARSATSASSSRGRGPDTLRRMPATTRAPGTRVPPATSEVLAAPSTSRRAPHQAPPAAPPAVVVGIGGAWPGAES